MFQFFVSMLYCCTFDIFHHFWAVNVYSCLVLRVLGDFLTKKKRTPKGPFQTVKEPLLIR
jgi:hypothetical protein